MQATKIIHIRSLRVFQGETVASAKALRQHMIAVFQEYQGSQCDRGRVHKGENKEQEGQRGVGWRPCRISVFQSTHSSFYSACGQNRQRVLCQSPAERFQAQVRADFEKSQGRLAQSRFAKNDVIQVETGLSLEGFLH